MRELGISEDAARVATAPLECIHGYGTREIEGFVGSDKSKQGQLKDTVEDWVIVVKLLAEFVVSYPQSVYYGLTILLQNYW